MTASDIIEEVQEQLADSGGDLFTDPLCLRWLNRSCKHISKRTRCIQRSLYRAKVADQEEYDLPARFLQMEILLINDGSQWYTVNRGIFGDIHRDRYFIQSTGNPWTYSIWGNARATRVSGTATGGSTTTLVDTSKDFSDFAKIGDKVLNTTDDSETIDDNGDGTGGITSIGTDTVTFNGGLAGGTDDSFAASDTYRIVSKSEHLKSMTIHPAPSASDTAGAESIRGLHAATHRLITQADIDNENDDLELDEDLEESLIFYMKYLARDYEGDDARMAAEYTLFQNEFRPARARAKKKIAENISRFRRHTVFDRRIRIVGSVPTENKPSWY